MFKLMLVVLTCALFCENANANWATRARDRARRGAEDAGGHLSEAAKRARRRAEEAANRFKEQIDEQAVSIRDAIKHAPNKVAKESLELAQKLLKRKATCKEFKIAHPGGYHINYQAMKASKKRGIFKSEKECKNFQKKKGKIADALMTYYFPKGKAAQELAGWDFTYFQCVCEEIGWD